MDKTILITPHDKERQESAAGAAILYRYFADVFLSPIRIPGREQVDELKSRTHALFSNTPNEPLAKPLIAWANKTSESPEEEQRAIAKERTILTRGINPEGPLPPYEAYYSSNVSSAEIKADAPSPSVARAYRDAHIHVDKHMGERDDYLGVELAFMAYLAGKELEELGKGNRASAEELSRMRDAFETNHISRWIPSYCSAALEHARTEFFKSVLLLLKALTSPAE